MSRKSLKKLMMTLAVASIGISSIGIMAKQGTEQVEVSYNNLKVTIDNTEVASQATQEPIMIEGKTYISVEELAKQLGYKISQDTAGKHIILTKIVAENGGIADQENNDTYLNAKQMSLNSTIKGNIGSESSKNKRDDEDWYKINIPEDGKLTLEFEGGEGVGVEVGLRDKSGSSPIVWKTIKNTKGLLSTGLQKGEYYIKVRRTAGSGDYLIRNTFESNSTVNDKEDNNTYHGAQSYELGAVAKGHLGYMNDAKITDTQDWYQLTIDQTEKIRLNLEGKDIEFKLFLYKSDATSPIIWKSGTNKVLTVEKELQSGNYYIKVERGPNNKGYGSYTLTSN